MNTNINLTRKEFIKGLGFGMAYLAGSKLDAVANNSLPCQLRPVHSIPIPTTTVRDITFDKQGKLLLTGTNRVLQMDPNGTQVLDLPILNSRDGAESRPTSVVVDSEGAIYVATTDEIHKFAPDGKVILSWGQRGNKEGELAYTTSLAVSENNLYVADAGNRKVIRFAVNGDFIDEIEDFHIPSAYFDLALDPKGFLHVAHTSEHRIECYDQNSKKVSEWGQFGGGLADFCGCCNPTNLAVLPNSWLVTSEKGIPRVKVYDPQGNLMACLTTENLQLSKNNPLLEKAPQPLGTSLPCHDGWPGLPIAVNPKGQIAIAIPGRNSVQVYELEGV